MVRLFHVFLFLLLFSYSFCQEVKQKKLRDLSPDRPHQTESSITTDKGHFMLEADLLNYRKETFGALATNALGVFYFNAKYGFHKNMDIEVLSGVFTKTHFSSPLMSDKKTFFGDFLFRYKLNIVGNDSGSFSVALMPMLNTSNMFEGKFAANYFGLIVGAVEHG